MRTKESLSISKTHLLQLCAEIEDNAALLYHLFAAQSEQASEIQKMWRTTALEEEEHANQFRLAGRLRGEAIDDVTIDEHQVLRVLGAVKAVIEKAKEKPPSYDQALQLSIQMEEKLAEFHLNSVATFCDDYCAKLFQSMAKNDKIHVARLRQAYEQAVSERR